MGAARGRPRNPLDRNVSQVADKAGEKVQQAFEDFLESHIEEPTSSAAPPSSELRTDKYYINQIHGLREFQLSTLYVDFGHLLSYKEGPILADAIANQYYRFLPHLIKGLHNLLSKYEPVYFKDHRQMTSNASQAGTSMAGNATSEGSTQGDKTINQQTDKLFTLALYNLPLVSRVRQLRTDQIGRLSPYRGRSPGHQKFVPSWLLEPSSARHVILPFPTSNRHSSTQNRPSALISPAATR